MKEFKFEEFNNCKFIVERYPNRNLKISIMSRTEGVICFVTCGIDKRLDDDTIAVKNYSENKGMDIWMRDNGYIESVPCSHFTSGFVNIPIYNLTQMGKETFLGM